MTQPAFERQDQLEKIAVYDVIGMFNVGKQ
ncbi:MAG: hypothetical protein QOG99_3711 [Frankiales bacterium]|jgi:hypothetical protein|nr:hypothetical protein [Frankiales bacterium]